ncbi:MAG: hypothetical protein CM15mV51_0700 [uncultured marine virus]|nr:MAG: hypothetical protein CM15mV51_0700 [uncultured marine virus]
MLFDSPIDAGRGFGALQGLMKKVIYYMGMVADH